MTNPKIRRVLILIHLYTASIVAPFFLLVAVTGSLYLARVEAKVESIPLTLPAGAQLDLISPTLEHDIRAVLAEAGIDIDFEYVRGRGNVAVTRPTSRPFVEFRQTPSGVSASLQHPNLQYRLMELHKGHGPKIFRTYQIFGGISLFLVVLGGLLVGILAKAYRKPTIYSLIGGTVLFSILAFFV